MIEENQDLTRGGAGSLMNELALEDLSPLQGRLPRLRDVSLPELADAFGLPDETKRSIRKDRPDVWNGGYLPVLHGDFWRYLQEDCREDNEQTPRTWMNIRELGQTSLLVPNWQGSVAEKGMKEWGVLINDPSTSTPRIVTFLFNYYQGTRQPADDCITHRGECRPHLCDGTDHHCVKYRGNDPAKGGRHFWCRCEEKET